MAAKLSFQSNIEFTDLNTRIGNPANHVILPHQLKTKEGEYFRRFKIGLCTKLESLIKSDFELGARKFVRCLAYC